MEEFSLSTRFEIERLYREVDNVTNIEELKKLTKNIILQNFQIKSLMVKLAKPI
jgi:hypothetical protein